MSQFLQYHPMFKHDYFSQNVFCIFHLVTHSKSWTLSLNLILSPGERVLVTPYTDQYSQKLPNYIRLSEEVCRCIIFISPGAISLFVEMMGGVCEWVRGDGVGG